jgi:hypothetical protein
MIDLSLRELDALEVQAYMNNDSTLSKALATLSDIRLSMDECEIDSLDDMHSDKKGLENKIYSLESELELYKQFFDDCFAQLAAHYPCPEVSSDYDCSVIYDAIAKGEGTRE